MMTSNNENLTPEQWDRLALWLDGREVTLTPREREEAQAFQRAESQFAPRGDFAVPPLAMARVQRVVALALRQQRMARWRFVGSMAAAAAAAIIVISMCIQEPSSLTSPPIGDAPAADLAALYEPAHDVELDLLDRQVEECRAQILVRPTLDDMRIQAIEKRLEELVFPQEPIEF